MRNFFYAMIVIFCIISFWGCSRNNIDGIKMNLIGEEVYPTIKNEHLGVELPANAITNWEIEDQGWRKCVKYYIDPYKRAHSYVDGVSADIEELICVDDDIKASEYGDPFEGTWITGLNETEGSYWYTDLKIANEVDISKEQSLGIIRLQKIYGTDKYRFIFENFLMRNGCKATIDELKHRNFSIKNIIWNLRQTTSPENHAGGISLADDAEYTVMGNKLIIKGHTINSNYPTWLEMELEYNESNNTLIVNKIDFQTQDEVLKKLVYLNFNKRDHKDILKRYQLHSTGFRYALVQIRMDQLVKNYPEFKDEWEQQKVECVHYAVIPGSEKSSRGWPEFPKIPE